MKTERLIVALAMGILATGLISHERLSRVASWIATAVLSAMLVVRSVGTGHLPVFGTFETDIAETCCLLLLSFPIARVIGATYLAGPCAASLLTLGHTWLLSPEPTPLTISEQSLWIDAHAVLAWLAWSFLFHALFLASRHGGGQAPALREDDPAGGVSALRLLGYGFLAQTAMGFVGVYYASVLFATPWSWDPVQSLGLLSWLLTGLAIHLRLFFNVSMFRQRYFMLFLVLLYVVSGKLPMLLPPGQTFHVFELGPLANLDKP